MNISSLAQSWITVNGNGEGKKDTEVLVGIEQLEVAQEWARRTAHDPNTPVTAIDVFPNGMSESSQRMIICELVFMGILKVRGHGLVMTAKMRQRIGG